METVLKRLEYINNEIIKINTYKDAYKRMYQLYFSYNELNNIFGMPINYSKEIKEFGKEILNNIFNIINESPKHNELIFIPDILRGLLENKFESMYDIDDSIQLMGHELNQLLDVTKIILDIFENYLYGVVNKDYYKYTLKSLIHNANPVSSNQIVIDYVRYASINILNRLEEEELIDLDEPLNFRNSNIKDEMRTFGIYRKEPLSKQELDEKITSYIVNRANELKLLKDKSISIDNKINKFTSILNGCKQYPHTDNLIINNSLLYDKLDELQKVLKEIKEAFDGGKENDNN